MTYVMAGIHGMYDAYRKLLDMVEFSDEDTLFVLGDVAVKDTYPLEEKL